jgi:hypothetical protein
MIPLFVFCALYFIDILYLQLYFSILHLYVILFLKILPAFSFCVEHENSVILVLQI